MVALAAMAFVVIGSLAGVAFVHNLGMSRLDAAGALSFAVILVVLWLAIFVEILRRPYSINLVHLFALYVLLGISPLYHVLIGHYPIAHYSEVDPRDVIRANVAIILWLAGYLGGYAASSATARRSLARKPDRWLLRSVPATRVRIELVVAIGVLAYLASLGLGGALTRRAVHTALEDLAGSPAYVINRVLVRYYPVVATASGLLFLRRVSTFRTPGTTLLILFVGAAAAWLANPFAAGRYWAATVALAVVAPHFLHGRRTGALTLLALVAGLTILPGLGQARLAQSVKEVAAAFPGIASPIQYLALNFDLGEYGFLVLTIRWIDAHGFTGGLQILGAILVWVPRFMWPGKPVATGTLVTYSMGFDFTNLAAPIVAEPLIDFGYLAVPVFAGLVGWVLARLDTIYWCQREGDARRLRAIDTFYPFLLGLQLLLVRGGLNYSLVTIGSVVVSALPMIAVLRSRQPRQAQTTHAVSAPPKPVGSAR